MPYPPGTSAGDPRAPWNAPDRSHDHDFFEMDGPIFEDGAAMFYATCNYAEGRYGEGWECEEERWWRCELDRIIRHREDAPDVAYLASEQDYSTPWGYIEVLYEDVLVAVERESRDGDLSVSDIDPPNDYGDGHVAAHVDGFTVIYKQDR